MAITDLLQTNVSLIVSRDVSLMYSLNLTMIQYPPEYRHCRPYKKLWSFIIEKSTKYKKNIIEEVAQFQEFYEYF